jgi:N-acetylated-alpha-linked acidic dipeptidase
MNELMTLQSYSPSSSLAVLALLGGSAFLHASPVRGFLEKDAPAEQKWEQQAQQLPDAVNLRRYLNYMAAEPHNAGSARSKAVAEYLLKRLKEWGLDAHIEAFEALMPYPTVRQVELVGPEHYTAKLKEPMVPLDPTSGQSGQLPTFNAYGATGDVTAEVVYVNFGLPDDYEWLTRQGISVKGKIVLARYGKSWRGIKPKIAAEHGAIGCLIYSDPHEDGYFESDVYPKGPMRPVDGVQRGSVMDMTIYPGDPLSPGWASEKGSKRLPIGEGKTLMKIPVLPISYGDAQPILEQLSGPVVPESWRGSLPLTYHSGPGAAQVHMKTDYDGTTKPLYDVIATIHGNEEPDQWIVAGNHHDAWVNGADDPVSGASALLETARVLGALQKQGWLPKRTIKIAFWDGEEFGLLGSTEWVEKHQEELRQKAAVYVNSDNTGRGWLNVAGSHSLEVFATEVADAIPQPGASTSLAEYALHHPPSASSDQPASPAANKPFTLGALGAGSDYQGFLDFIGVASLNNGFEGQTKSGIYHSAYDSIYWYTHFSDTNQADGRALSQYTTASLLRLADSSVLPFEFQHLAATINGYLDEIQKEADTSSHRMDFSNLRKQLEALKQSGVKYEALLEAAEMKPALDAAKARDLNELLIRSERVLTRPEGLPNRPWYKHQLYAPGFYTGYGVKTLPGVREAVEAKNWQLAQHEAGVVEECLSDLNQLMDQAVDKLAGF